MRHEGGNYIDGKDNCVLKCSTCNEIIDNTSQHSLFIDTDDNCASKCSRCGYVEATGQHQSLTEERVEPTADTNGYVKKYCLDCGYVMSNQVLPATGMEPNRDLVVENAVESIEAGVKYYGVLAQQNINKLLYLDGKMFNDWYLNTTEDIESAATLSFEFFSDGVYYMYFGEEDNKTYVNVYMTDDGKTDIGLDSYPVSTWMFSEAFGCLVGLADDVMFLGTSNTGTYNNICTKQVDVIDDYFLLQLVKAEESSIVESDGTFNYTLNSDKRSYSVSAVDGFKNADLNIPDEYKGLPVTKLAENAFQNLGMVKNVTMPQSITVIGKNAFFNCTSITIIMIPEGVSTIEENAFARCKSLQTIHIPAGVTTIGDNAFSSCTSLSSVNYAGSAADWKKITVGSNNDCLTGASFNYEGGEGDVGGSDDPVTGEVITVNSADSLIDTINKINNGAIAKNVTIELTQSINMSGKTFTPIYDFRGVFDGKSYTISNITLPSSGTAITVSDGNWAEYGINAIGFINTAYGATVKNLTLENVTANFTTASNVFVGALAGFADGLTVQDCTVISSLDVTVAHTGYSTISGVAGLIGYSLDASAERVNIDTVVDYTANSGEAFTAAVLGAGNIRIDESDIQLEVTYTHNSGAGHTGSIIGMERTPDGVTLTYVKNSTVTGSVKYNRSMYAMGVIGQGDGGMIDTIENRSGNTINVSN